MTSKRHVGRSPIDIRSVASLVCLCLAVVLGGCAGDAGSAAGDAKAQNAAAPPAIPSPTRRVYVANEGSGTISVIDGKAMQVVGTVDLDTPGNHDLALTRDGKTLFVTNLATGTLWAIDTVTGAPTASVYTGKLCHSVALTNDDRFAWVANIGDNSIAIVDATDLRVVGRIPVGKNPGHVRFAKDGRFAYVNLQGEDSVGVIDVAKLEMIEKIPVGESPHFVIADPDGRYIWGGATGADYIFVIDETNQRRVATLTVGPTPQHIAFGYKGMIGPLAYVVVQKQDEVVVVTADPGHLKILERIHVGHSPSGIGANPTGTRLYVSNQADDTISVIDTSSSRVIATIAVDIKPIGVLAQY